MIPNFLTAFTNAFKIQELRKRIFFTLVIVVITRIGAAIPVPGVDANALRRFFETQQETQGSGFLTLLNIFSGGALEQMAIFSLTIMPYISASIIFQLLTAVIPQLSKIVREEGGRQKITQYTRIATIFIALFQSFIFARAFENPKNLPMFSSLPEDVILVPDVGPVLLNLFITKITLFDFTTVVTLTGGTILMMWLGEQITERGIGNGISMLIATNILARFPAAVGMAFQMFFPAPGIEREYHIIHAALFIAMFLAVIAAVIVVTQAQRKITVQYAQRMVGRKMFGGGQTYMPLKVNYSGVMPVIFASAILMFPKMIFGFVNIDIEWLKWLNRIDGWLNERGWVHMTAYAVMIFFFSYFWVATVFNPIQIADDLKKHGGYVPGVRPGKPTADFLADTMERITFAGAIFLVVVALIPQMLYARIPPLTANFFGGTSLLIVVGVLLDTLRQIETHLITHNYEGFLKKGRMKGRI